MKYGWKPDLPDHRDFRYAVSAPIELPQSVDLSTKCSPVEDQKSIGSCTGNALVGNLEYLEMTTNSTNYVDLSRLFVYYNERVIEGTVDSDSGAMLRDGIKSLVSDGVCSESLWPYDPNIFMIKPTDQCYREAQSRKISAYFRLNNLNDMLRCLADGYPFVFGFSVYDYFESAEMARTGKLRMPTPDEGMLGGHAVCCLPGTIITTKRGFIPIEDIEKGDEVLTHSGRFKKVLNVFSRGIDEEILVIPNNVGDDLKVTKEHPFYTKKYKNQTKMCQTKDHGLLTSDIIWDQAQYLSCGSLLYCPIYDGINNTKSIIQSEEFFELLGMYIGDGNIAIRHGKNGTIKSMKLRFSLGKNYPELINRCSYLLKKFSKNSVGVDNFKNHINLVCYDTSLAKMIGSICGFAKNKKIPFSILESSTVLQRYFLKGWYETDGCRVKNDITISTSDYELMQGMIFILKRLRLLYSVTTRPSRITIMKNKACLCRESYHICMCNIDDNFFQIRTKHRSIYCDKYLIFKVKEYKKEQYSGKVYNISVEEDNSYVANGIAVHNCSVGYDQSTRMILVRNSWNIAWGLRGYFWMPFEYVENRDLSDDFWTIRK